MSFCTQTLIFDGQLLQRGFWIYVWIIRHKESGCIYFYVGRTGDSSSANASSPFNRVGQHLNFKNGAKSNSLARLLQKENLDCAGLTFELSAHGPIHKEEKTRQSHDPVRDRVSAMEYALAEKLTTAIQGASRFKRMGNVACRKSPPDCEDLKIVDQFLNEISVKAGIPIRAK